MFRAIRFAIFLILLALPVQGQDLRALARVLPEESQLTDQGRGIELQLALSQAVPYRIFSLSDPHRVVLDFREVNWSGLTPAFDASERVTRVQAGSAGTGWTRMVLQLEGPFGVESSELVSDEITGEALLTLYLSAISEADFAAVAGAPDGVALPPEPLQASAPAMRQDGAGQLRIVLDPGHGGFDPGAQAGGYDEADLMLIFAHEMREVLIRTGRAEVFLTREGDRFVPLTERVSIARERRADLFLSFHADALAEGHATGATVYTLSEEASDAASQALAEAHDRADILAGVDLSGSDDVVADVLLDLARLETAPRTDALADHIVEGLRQGGALLYQHPRREAGFSVLKAADIPSVLIELGYLTEASDRANLVDPDWRASVQQGLAEAILLWAAEDAASAPLVRH